VRFQYLAGAPVREPHVRGRRSPAAAGFASSAGGGPGLLRRTVPRTLRLAQGPDPLPAAEQPGGRRRPGRAAGGYRERERGRARIIRRLEQDHGVILAERVAGRHQLTPQRLDGRPDGPGPVLRLP
jgi:hypothetical protein